MIFWGTNFKVKQDRHKGGEIPIAIALEYIGCFEEDCF